MKTVTVQIRCTPEEKAEWQAKADELGIYLSELIRLSVQLSIVEMTAQLAAKLFNDSHPMSFAGSPTPWQDTKAYTNLSQLEGSPPTITPRRPQYGWQGDMKSESQAEYFGHK